MFEKEAEEYVDKHTTYTDFAGEENAIAHIDVSTEQAYIAGAEFGYNKAKEEIEAELLKCYQGYPKENE